MSERAAFVTNLQSAMSESVQLATAPDHFVVAEVRGFESKPLGRRRQCINELYPEAGGRLETAPASDGKVARTIVRRLGKDQHLKMHLRSDAIDRIANGIVGELASPNAEYYEVGGDPSLHPFEGFTYWTYWILVLDRSTGRAVALALGASD